MNILYTLNDAFVPQVGAGIASVCENNKRVKSIHFYLLSYGIKDDNKKKLEKLVKKYKRHIDILEVDDLSKYFTFDFDTGGWNQVILVRLLMGEILPKDINRIIYMDGDTIVRGSLKELWNLDLKDNILGMSIEPTIDKTRIVSLDIEGYPYYNSGVLLVDLKKWREREVAKQIFDYYKKHEGNLFAADQDAINGTLKGQIMTISPKYNFYNIFNQYPYKFFCKTMKPLEYISKETYDDAIKNPVIIHYLGEERPWRKGNTHRYRKDYKKYLSLTDWKDTPDEEGWGLYFFCWRIFNFLMKPFPGLRLKIINYLIPSFMKIRKKQLSKNK
ncbi:MAG: glycosyltransferase family 8 protein [Bacilli bacterium]|nr:glycosyltransferase family 8 protein [Bacilli bacterium]